MLKDKSSKKEGANRLKLAVPLRRLAGNKIIKITETILTILLSNNGNNEA